MHVLSVYTQIMHWQHHGDDWHCHCDAATIFIVHVFSSKHYFDFAGKPVHAFAPKGCPPAVFDRFLNMVAEASARNQFHRAPVGPIGSLLTLAEERWGVAVEIALGRALGTFVVHDFADQKLLQVIHILQTSCCCREAFIACHCFDLWDVLHSPLFA